MQVVSNTSPLSALSIIGRLGLLRAQFGTIRIPRAVWAELSRLEPATGRQALQQAHAEGWIEVHETANRPMLVSRDPTDLSRSRWVSENSR